MTKTLPADPGRRATTDVPSASTPTSPVDTLLPVGNAERSRQIDKRSVRWNQHNAARRSQILDAAIELIEEHPPGTEIRVQEIADRAGLVRTVVYRHFDGRGDLDRAIQQHAVDKVREAVQSGVRAEGSIEEIIGRVVGGLVEWASTHPHLYLLAERDLGDDQPGELLVMVRAIASNVASLITMAAGLFGVSLDKVQTLNLDLFTFGLVGQVRGTVNHWIRMADDAVSPRQLTTLLTDAIWFQIDGFARTVGLDLDRDVTLDALVAAAQPTS